MWNDLPYKKEYDKAREAAEVDLPPWFKLTPPQRNNVKRLIDDYWNQLDGICEAGEKCE